MRHPNLLFAKKPNLTLAVHSGQHRCDSSNRTKRKLQEAVLDTNSRKKRKLVFLGATCHKGKVLWYREHSMAEAVLHDEEPSPKGYTNQNCSGCE